MRQHPQFDRRSLAYNVAILKLDGEPEVVVIKMMEPAHNLIKDALVNRVDCQLPMLFDQELRQGDQLIGKQ